MGRLKLDGKTVPIGIFVLLFSVCATVLGWNLRSMAEEVSQNSDHRVAENATQEYVKAAVEEQKKQICWLENSVRAIHDEQQVDRHLLNRIAHRVGAEEGPEVRPLLPQDY